MIRIFFASFCLLELAVTAHADAPMLAPKYDVVSTNPDGSKYAGTATIEDISDKTIKIGPRAPTPGAVPSASVRGYLRSAGISARSAS
jgi:hypothetical protein